MRKGILFTGGSLSQYIGNEEDNLTFGKQIQYQVSSVSVKDDLSGIIDGIKNIFKSDIQNPNQ